MPPAATPRAHPQRGGSRRNTEGTFSGRRNVTLHRAGKKSNPLLRRVFCFFFSSFLFRTRTPMWRQQLFVCMCVCPRRRKPREAALRGPEAGWAPTAPTNRPNGPNGPNGGWSGTFVPRRGAGPGRGALPASSRCRGPPPGAGGAAGSGCRAAPRRRWAAGGGRGLGAGGAGRLRAALPRGEACCWGALPGRGLRVLP